MMTRSERTTQILPTSPRSSTMRALLVQLCLCLIHARQLTILLATRIFKTPLPIEEIQGKVRYRARVAYDGAGFQGFQLQPRARTVQGEIEQVLSRRFQRLVRVVGAGRTDAGVHARGQAIHFDLNEDDMQSEEDVRKLEHSINRMLGRDVCVYNLQEAPITTKEIQGKNMNLQWNAIHDATGKLYIYRISATKSMDPIERHTRWDLKWRDTDMDLLERTLKRYQGTHDFRSFAGNVELLERSLGGRLDTRRTVNSVNVVDESEGLYRIEVHLNGALYKMVRNLIGTAMEVAWGRLSEADFEALLNNASGRKENKSKPAPPEGLTLEHVYYDGY